MQESRQIQTFPFYPYQSPQPTLPVRLQLEFDIKILLIMLVAEFNHNLLKYPPYYRYPYRIIGKLLSVPQFFITKVFPFCYAKCFNIIITQIQQFGFKSLKQIIITNNMLSKKIATLFSRFFKPRISQYDSIFQLLDDKRWGLNFIEQKNRQTLEKTKDQPYYDFEQLLKIKKQTIQNSISNEIEVFAYSPIAHKKYTVRQNLVNDQLSYDFLPQDIQNPFTDNPVNAKTHYSIKNREVPVIEQYQIDANTVILFNLPEDVTEEDITRKIPMLNIQNIHISFCLLGLPSYAKITFEHNKQFEKFVSVNKQYLKIGQKLCYFYTEADQQRLNLQNRLMVIKNLPENISPNSLFIQLSKYGRLTYFDHPQTIEKGISMEQAKYIYRDSSNRVKLNFYRNNGTIESEYYPPYIEKDLTEPFQELSKNNFNYNVSDQMRDEQQKNKRKLKYAQNINIYQRKIGTINIVPKNFAIFAFSCPDQAQNCYFSLKNTRKIELVKDKYEFHFDKTFKQRLLRYIDNQFLAKRVQQKENKVDQLKLFYSMSLSLMERLKYEEFVQINKKRQIKQRNQWHYQWAVYTANMEHIIKTVGERKQHGKSFDELAEMQLFGRVLPKHQNRKTLKLQNYDAGRQKSIYDFQNPSLDGIPKSRKIGNKILRAKKRKQRIEKNFAQGITTPVFEGSEPPQISPQDIEDIDVDIDQADFEGKRHFSTFKAQKKTRTMTWDQIAHKNLKFNEFIRDTINQYLGIFSDEKLDSSFSREETKFINPHRVKFLDGSEFLTDQTIPRILEFHRNPSEAKTNYQGHVIIDQIIKSKQMDVNQFILADQQLRNIAIYKEMMDTGIVKDIYEFQQEDTDIDSVVQNLNAVEAKFGQEYRKVQKDGKQYIVKIKKLDHIYPLDRINNISNFTQEFEKKVDINKLKLVQKHFQQMTKTGKIPKQLQQAFGQTSETFEVDQVFSEVGISHGIWKKDIETIMNLQNYSEAEIERDIGVQLAVQKVRSKERPIDHNDLAKDPDNIDVKGQNGQYAVSKFRQI